MDWEGCPCHVEGCRGFLLIPDGHRHSIIRTRSGQTGQILGWKDFGGLTVQVGRSTRHRVAYRALSLERLCLGGGEQGA